PLAVQQRAVLAAQVGQEGAVGTPADLRAVAREPLVGQEDVAVARAADGHAVLVDLLALARAVRALDRDFGHGRADSTARPGAAGPAPGAAWAPPARLGGRP